MAALHVDEDELPEVTHGYRLDALHDDGRIGFFGAPEEIHLMGRSPRPKVGIRRWTPAAFCLERNHLAPNLECWCGWHMDTSLTALAEMRCCANGLSATGFVSGSLRRYRATPRTIPGNSIQGRAVVAEVTGHGRCLPGNFRDDTPTTMRVDRLRLEGWVWIHTRVDAEVVEAVRERYPFARIERFPSLAELAAEFSGAAA